MGMVRGKKKADPAKKGVPTGKTPFSGKQNERGKSKGGK